MPAVVISVVIVVPVVVMIETAMRAIPIAGKEAATFVTRADPMRARVRRAGPVATMPDVAAIYGIPITVNPKVAWSGACRHDVMAWWGRRPNLNANCDLRSGVVSAHQEH
jgi:hypothetical protein